MKVSQCGVGERMISACVFPAVKHGGGVVVWWCFAGDTVCDLFRIQGTLNQHGFHNDTPSHLGCAWWDYHLFFNRTMTQNTPPGCVMAIWPRRRGMEWPVLHNHPTSTQLRWFGMSWTAEWRKSSQQLLSVLCVETPSRLLKNHSRWSWLRECQECTKLSSRQRVATLKNLKYKIYTDCLTLFWLLRDSICVIS